MIKTPSTPQVEAWAPAIPDPAQVDARASDGRLVLVAVNAADEPVAYGDLEATGHVDHLYCHPDFGNAGVASALYDHLEQKARERGLTRLFVEASEAARAHVQELRHQSHNCLLRTKSRLCRCQDSPLGSQEVQSRQSTLKQQHEERWRGHEHRQNV